MNTAAALGHVFGVVRLIYKVLEDKTLRLSANTPELLDKFEQERANWVKILGVFGQDPAQFFAELKQIQVKRKGLDVNKIEGLLQERKEARQNKDFAASDAIRDELLAMGIEVRDTPAGVEWDIA